MKFSCDNISFIKKIIVVVLISIIIILMLATRCTYGNRRVSNGKTNIMLEMSKL